MNACPGLVQIIRRLAPIFRASGDIVWVRSEFDEASFTADSQASANAFAADENARQGPVGGVDDDDDENDTEEEDDDEEEEEEEDDGDENEAEEQEAVPSYSLASSPVIPHSALHRPFERANVLLSRVSARLNAQNRESRSPIPNQRRKNEAFLASLGTRPASICCVPGTFGADYIEGVKSTIDEEKDRLIVKAKCSAFEDTNLLLFLRTNFVTELYICGSLSYVSVYATAADAVKHGFTITVLEDCLGYRDEAKHMAAMRQMADVMGADGITSTELMEELVGTSSEQEDVEDRTAFKSGTAHSATVELALRTFSESVSLVKATDGTTDTSVPKELRRSSKKSSTDLDPETSLGPSPVTTAVSLSSSSAARQGRKDDESPGGISTSTAQTRSQEPKAYKAHPDTRLARGQRSEMESGLQREGPIGLRTNAGRPDVPSPELGLKTGSAPSRPTQSSVTTPSTSQPIRPLPAGSHVRTLGPQDKIGEGDSQIINDILSESVADEMFRRVRDEVQWQKMHHRTGEVPRLVACQGDVDVDGSVPVYRHPADESPPLRPFSPAVAMIRDVTAKVLQQPLNHVLIQLYRDGQDNISEHSDKTLDIVHGSKIVNVSLGAQRAMTLRTKKAAKDYSTTPSTSEGPVTQITPRETQRIVLPHNSMFVLGQDTNMQWLHGVRPDKRPSSEKSSAELAFSGERISLTFRHIGTSLNNRSGLIWGQGGRSKSKSRAGKILNGESKEAESMIRAFGKENHQSDFNWEAEYGNGFDVLNFVTPAPKLFISNDHIANVRVELCLAQYGVSWEAGKAQSGLDSDSNPSRVCQLPKFIDNDPDKSIVEGDLAIMLYLNRFYNTADHGSSSPNARVTTARVLSRVGQAENLLHTWRNVRDPSTRQETSTDQGGSRNKPPATQKSTTNRLVKAIKTWESYMNGTQYLAGDNLTIADWAFWPVLKDIIENLADWDGSRYPDLNEYHGRILRWAHKQKVLR